MKVENGVKVKLASINISGERSSSIKYFYNATIHV
jgi:hypothetical protein